MILVVIATVIVFVSLSFRQEPLRTPINAYISMRTLSPMEVAALLTFDENNKTLNNIIHKINDKHIVLLTRNYVIPIDDSKKDTFDKSVVVKGKGYRVVNNSWEDYLCQYRVERFPLEKILGHSLFLTPKSEIVKNKFDVSRISFSSDDIWVYVVIEILLISSLIGLIFYILLSVNFLLWIPYFVLIDFALFLFILWYSPAFFDGDFFYQRIVIENFPLYFIDYGLILALVSLFLFLFYKAEQSLKKENIFTRLHYHPMIRTIIIIGVSTIIFYIMNTYGCDTVC